MPRIAPNLWFDTEAEEAAAFYTSTFPNSRVVAVTRYGEAGPREAGLVMTVEFELDGQRFVAINGGPEFLRPRRCRSRSAAGRRTRSTTTGARLTADGGEEASAAGSRTGTASAMVTPIQLEEMILDPDQEKVDRVM